MSFLPDVLHLVMNHLRIIDIHALGACDRAVRAAMLRYLAQRHGRVHVGGRELLLREIGDDCAVDCVHASRVHRSVRKLRIRSRVIMPSFVRATRLTELVLDGCGLGSFALHGLPRTLRALSLRGNQVASLEPLGVLTELERLDLSDNQVRGTNLPVIAALPGLEVLSLAGNVLFNAAGKHLAESRTLKCLDVTRTYMDGGVCAYFVYRGGMEVVVGPRSDSLSRDRGFE